MFVLANGMFKNNVIARDQVPFSMLEHTSTFYTFYSSYTVHTSILSLYTFYTYCTSTVFSYSHIIFSYEYTKYSKCSIFSIRIVKISQKNNFANVIIEKILKFFKKLHKVK